MNIATECGRRFVAPPEGLRCHLRSVMRPDQVSQCLKVAVEIRLIPTEALCTEGFGDKTMWVVCNLNYFGINEIASSRPHEPN